MPVTAKQILDRARRIVQDETSVRWPLAELTQWLNDALREVVLLKPSASSKNVVLDLQAGTYQPIPDEYLSLLRVVRNVEQLAPGGVRVGGRAVRLCPRDVLDAQHPDWHMPEVVPFKAEVKHYIYDEADPKTFYVYPGNDGTGQVEAIMSKEPDEIVASADPEELDSYSAPIDLPAIYANAVLDYVLYRAYSKDAQYAGNAERAGIHYTQFQNSLGMKAQSEANNSPNMTRGVRPG